MNIHTESKVILATKEKVFTFIANINNLPKWATGFAKEVKNVDGKYKVITEQGEIFFRMKSDADTGVIDMYGGPAEDRMIYFPSRVVALPGGTCAYHFTNYQWPGVTDEAYASQNKTLTEEFENIRQYME